MQGLPPALMREASYSTIRFGAYEPLRELFSGGATGRDVGYDVFSKGFNKRLSLTLLIFQFFFYYRWTSGGKSWQVAVLV